MFHRSGAGAAGVVLSALALLSASGQPAKATDGYFQMGFGARQAGLGGAGVADSRDAMSQTLNPAGLIGIANQWQIGVSGFLPYRGYDASGTFFVAPGSVDSNSDFFLIPNFAVSHQIDGDSAWGVSLYGNGGMNTNYPAVANPSPNPMCGPGVFCAGKAGVDLMQAFLSVDYARQFGPVKIGVAPTFAIQRFKSYGLAAFSGISADPAHLTDNGYDFSYGGGLRAGLEWDAMPGLRFGLSGQTKMYMTRFDKYAGLFADRGSFDIPAAVTAGVAVDVAPKLTLMADYQRIFYGDIDSIADPSSVPLPLGSKGGPGFGWHDVDVFKIGAEWRATDRWALRAGYAYTDNPIGSSDVTFNILAPGIVRHHITAGASYKVSDRDTIEFAGIYVPDSKLSGQEVTPAGATPGSNITVHMHQYQFSLSWTRRY